MNTAVNLNMVHEAEAQRQHARVKLPCVLHFQGKHQEPAEVRLTDLSAGGFSFIAGKEGLQVGDYRKGRLQFLLDGLGLSIDIEFQVRSVDDNHRVGCQLHSLKPSEQATLRYLISNYLGGELVSTGDLLSTLQRDNFTKARKNKAGAVGMGALGRLRAVTFSFGVLVIGVAAFATIAHSLYNLYFVTHAKSAMVSVPSLQVTMPREGMVNSLLGDETIVAKGAPIASFSASMLEMLKGHLTEDQLTPGNVEALFGKQLQGTLTSPCNCKVARQLVADGQFASKGQTIFELVPQDTRASITASFPYRDLERVKPGTRASFRLAGEDSPRYGTVVSSSLHEGGLSSDIRVVIEPEQTLPSSLSSQPVEVTLDRGPSLDWMIDTALAAGL
ncbi:MAG TPA: alginate biosynthesis protein Alg44 [Pseudomonas sp.]|uniref:alginate biosynthesis protein Alg44 n=1 Tax=Pseudomonas sp. TaxID=306 RepID=UPI002C29B5AB|nr:alginate biosynthesis protein Alg44 [Pseudomonas sp.]HSX90072.1 alginate biosynthesis protein Alg44 [Pseudomonas sp.]